MNERYTYGYNIGWNVENEYISNTSELMDVYNEQVKAIYEILTTRRMLENELNNEEIIRETYNEYYTNSTKSYEDFRNNVLKRAQERLNANRIEYLANVYYLIEIKNETRKMLNQRRMELSLELEQTNLELSSINLEMSRTPIEYDENRNIKNSEQRISLRRKYEEISLKKDKIEHALGQVDELFENIKFTSEEKSLMLNGLSPDVRTAYENLDKTDLEKITKEDNSKKPKEEDESIGNTGSDEEKEDDKSNTDEIEEYQSNLEDYNQDLAKLYELQEKYEKGEIEYSEYEEYADYMVERYKFIKSEYEKLVEINPASKEYENLSVEDLNLKLQEIKKEFEEELAYRTHNENGMEYHDDLDVDYNNRKKAIEDEIKRRELLNSVTKPEQPMMILEKIENKDLDNEYEIILAWYKKQLSKYKDMFNQLNEIRERYNRKEISLEKYAECERIAEVKYNQIKSLHDFVLERYYEEVEKYQGKKEIEKPEEPEKIQKYVEKIEKKRKNKKLFLRTIAAIAIGAGIGITVAATAGSLGVTTLAITGVTGKMITNAFRAKAKSIDELKKIDDIDPPKTKLQRAARAVKNYFRSKEGLRDISVVLGSAVVSASVYNLVSQLIPKEPTPEPPGPEKTTPDETTDKTIPDEPIDETIPGETIGGNIPEKPTPTPPPTYTPDESSVVTSNESISNSIDPSNLAIGDSTDGLNLSQGHDTAQWALNGTNTENLIPEYVNPQNTTVKSFWANGEWYTQPGLTAGEVANLAGVPIDQVAVDLGNGGISVSWNTIAELFDGVTKGGMKL